MSESLGPNLLKYEIYGWGFWIYWKFAMFMLYILVHILSYGCKGLFLRCLRNNESSLLICCLLSTAKTQNLKGHWKFGYLLRPSGKCFIIGCFLSSRFLWTVVRLFILFRLLDTLVCKFQRNLTNALWGRDPSSKFK